MAIDEAILEAHLNAEVPPTLRLYQFSPPVVSFGYAQKVEGDLVRRIKAKGFDVVRRPTGGRAVLHFKDLTYAFICSSKGATVEDYILVETSVISAYKQICQALILAFKALGIETILGSSKSNYRDKNDCFLATTLGDLQHQGNKLVGSAQLRRRYGVLQHGSIILNQPQFLMEELLGDSSGTNGESAKSGKSNIQHHANLFDISMQKCSIADIEQKIVNSFEQTFNCQFIEATLTTNEQKLVEKLVVSNQHSIEC